jgi:hypothetical protein
MYAGVEEIDPDAHLGALEIILWQQPHLRIFFLQVFVDDRGLVNHAVAVHQHRHFSIGIQFEQILRFFFQIDFDQLIGNFLFRQDNPCPVSVRSGMGRIKFHDRRPPLVDFTYHPGAVVAMSRK